MSRFTNKMVKHSNMLKNDALIPNSEWCDYVDSLKTKKSIGDEKKAASTILPLFEEAVKKRIPNERFGIFFSGGVDSTFIAYVCKKFTDDFVCYTVGIEGSRDIAASKEAAKKLGLKHKVKTLSLKEMENIFEKTAKILGKDLVNIVNIGVGAVEVAAIEIAKKDGIKYMFSGLGSEEIFAGYQRHEKAGNINEECWQGLKSMWERDFMRDFKIADFEGIEALTPFLDKELIIAAMQIDGSLKIKGDVKKYILRRAATSAGLAEEFAFRPKVAAQYGSSFDKAISRIGKSKGHKFKKGYLDYLSNLK
jgi:asparagine synthetase B (glutamine-hydrolysing)